MAADDPKKIDMPKSAKKASAKGEDVVIHVMPKEFIGKEASTKEPVKAPPPPPPPKPAVVVPPPKPVPAKKKKSKAPLFIVLGIIFILLLALVGYFVVQSAQPEPEPVPIPDPVPTPDPDPVPVTPPEPVVTRGVDTDTDGLTDREESLYGTDFRNPDSDGDSFLDGNEVFHRFDPIGFAPSTLLDTGSVVEYADEDYRLTYPRSWTLSASPDSITLQSTTSARFSVTRHDLVEEDFPAWYAANVSATATEFIQKTSKEGYSTFETDDEMVVYMLANGSVFEFHYLLASSLTIDYLQTFQMVVNSFIYAPVE